MEEMFKTLPQHTCCWPPKAMVYNYQGFWNSQQHIEKIIMAQESFKAQPNNVFICSSPKTGTTWLKALAFAIVTREKFNESTSPLLKMSPHDCIPMIEGKQTQKNDDNIHQLVATHLPYDSLPNSVKSSDCKIVYVYRNIKDVIVSHYNFVREAVKMSPDEAPFQDAFNEFYQGVSWYGPYWDHILGYWKASMERPTKFFLLKYEDMKSDPISNVKRLAKFIGYPISIEEENAGVVDNIIKLCSFGNLSNLDVNKNGSLKRDHVEVENRIYFRKAKDGDWENYFTDEMKEKIDKLIDEKMGKTGLVLK